MTYEMYLAHHGIKGQKWGVRRYQNPDGSLTAAGKQRYRDGTKSDEEKLRRYDELVGVNKERKAAYSDRIKSFGVNPKGDDAEELMDLIEALRVKYSKDNKNWNRSAAEEAYRSILKKYGKTPKDLADLDEKYKDYAENGDEELYNLTVDLGSKVWNRKKLKHSQGVGTDFKMEPKYLELSSVLVSLDPSYLEHHGIKGQKWGVEHGPPYPLKTGVSARIKRAAKSVKNRVEANRKERATKREAKEEKRRQKNPTLQDRINQMSDEELTAAANRLKKENAYLDELGKRQARKGDSFLKKSSDLINDLKTAGEAVAGFVEMGKKVSHAFGLDKLEGDDEDPVRRSGESLADYTVRMKRLAQLKESRDKLSGSVKTSQDSSSSKKEEKKDPTPTSTAKTAVPTSDYGWTKDRSEKEDSRVSSLREEAKKWNVDIDKPVEKVWDYSDRGNSWFKQTFSDTKPSNFSDWTKDDDDEKKKKGD